MSSDSEKTLPGVLVCDCGNSGVSIAGAQGKAVSSVQTYHLGELHTMGQGLRALWEELPAPKKLIAVSVNAPALKALEAAADETLHEDVLLVGRELPPPIETDLPNPASIGADRLCCAAAAFDRMGAACVVADFGTAITIDCVNGEGVFLGGVILPGLRASAQVLHETTDQLPLVDLREPNWVFGGDTKEAIVGGLVYGARGALRERVEAYATELGAWPIVILTGGDASLICPTPGQDGLVQAVVKDLCLRGAAITYYKTLLQDE